MYSKTCIVCLQEFETRFSSQKFCVTCNDIRHRRPTVALEHTTLEEFLVKVKSLPQRQWVETGGKDHKSWKLDMRGNNLPYAGLAYESRIVIYSKINPDDLDVALMRVRQSVHQNKDGKEETRQYIVLEETEVHPEFELHWGAWGFKTTLKGLGRQWRETLLMSEPPVWAQEISCGYRSGRAGGYGRLMVTNPMIDISIERDDFTPTQPVRSEVKQTTLYGNPLFDYDDDDDDDAEYFGKSTLANLRSSKLFDDDENK